MQQLPFVRNSFIVLFVFSIISSALLIEGMRILEFKLGDQTNIALALIAFGLLTSLVCLLIAVNFTKNPYDNKNKFLYIAYIIAVVPKILVSYILIFDDDRYKKTKDLINMAINISFIYDRIIFLFRAFNLEIITNILLIILGPLGIYANYYMNRAFLKISTTPTDPNQLYEVQNLASY